MVRGRVLCHRMAVTPAGSGSLGIPGQGRPNVRRAGSSRQQTRDVMNVWNLDEMDSFPCDPFAHVTDGSPFPFGP